MIEFEDYLAQYGLTEEDIRGYVKNLLIEWGVIQKYEEIESNSISERKEQRGN